jgi:ElaB/YqjD/DUF883 family membrane-anchored ribosome-binding protein
LDIARHSTSTKVSSNQVTLIHLKMATRNQRSRTVELADADANVVEVDCNDNSSRSQSETLRDQERGNSVLPQSEMEESVALGDNEAQNSLVVTNDKNDSEMSARIQGMLADILSTLSSIQSQNSKTSETLAAKLMAENQKLEDRLTEKLQYEITKVTEAISHSSDETRQEIQSVRDELNKLSSSVDERVSRHIKSTKHEHEVLHKEINAELKVAKQEINILKQDVNKRNQEVQDSFSRSELVNAQKFAEVDKQVADLREQVSSIANNTNLQSSNTTLSDAIPMRIGPSGNNAASETYASNSTCMNESVEMGCSHGMHGNVLHGNVCPMTPVNLSVPNNASPVLPELALPKFISRNQSAVHFLRDLDECLKIKSVDEHLKLALVSKSLTEEFARSWFMATKEHITSYEEFNIKFLGQFWSKELQSHKRAQIYRCRYDKSADGSMASHLLKHAVLGTSLGNPLIWGNRWSEEGSRQG